MITVEILPPEAEAPRPPLPGPLIVRRDGMALMPQPDGSHAWMPLRAGLELGWMPVPELGGIVLAIASATFPAERFATTLSRGGLRGLIADLQSIERQLGEIG